MLEQTKAIPSKRGATRTGKRRESRIVRYLRYFLAWMPLVFLGIGNAAIRQALYAGYMSELAAHQISTLTLIILYAVYAWVVFGFLRLYSPSQAMAVGLMWMVLTVVFEFGLGRYVMGDPWGNLLHSYNIVQGRVWGLFILWVGLAPYVFYRIRA